MIFMQTASKWYMLRLTLFMERGQYSVDSNHFWVRYWLFFLSDYRASQTSPVYGFNQMCWYCMTGTQWRLTLGDEIGRDLTIRFSRQSKYLQSNFHVQTVQSAQLSFFLFFFLFMRAGEGERRNYLSTMTFVHVKPYWEIVKAKWGSRCTSALNRPPFHSRLLY